MKKKLIIMYLVSAISGLLANLLFWTSTIMYGITIPIWLFGAGCVIMPVSLLCALWSIYQLKLIRDKEQP